MQMESVESEKTRFEVECEFVQALANPNYLNFLAQRGYFKEEYFVNYLKYLLYWKDPQYARCLKFPQCLHMLEALQSQQFRDSMAYGPSAKFVEDQVVLQWQFYLRKRHRLCMMPDEGQELEESEDEADIRQKDTEDEDDEETMKKPDADTAEKNSTTSTVSKKEK
ncbi:Mediator of RNA polymerase II transcription subunit 31 [Caenorhabditis elegans]|nr:Mediator of RNA polymerase II transcription subunit 31 [Caenorhabditis elegans]CAB04242.2 Mediator of RNA polymerase II transcription subunit 31 [Caenorhabditis elegans]|eukprot:NP_001250948.1 Mediator of RNA polymerase II transcription subunit 31 [Caenorhabditis elegans]